METGHVQNVEVRYQIHITDVDATKSNVAGKGKKGKKEYLYSAFSHQGTYKALRHGSHTVSYTHLTLPTIYSV